LNGNKYGVLLYRAKGCRIYGNTITGGSIIANSRGVTLHETTTSFVAGNSISNQAYGLAFWSTGVSLYGTQWNSIGQDHDLTTWNGIGQDHNLTTWKNTYTGNTTKMAKWVSGMEMAAWVSGTGIVANNTIRD
jgi:nitrous oxidase accessory protein NosD